MGLLIIKTTQKKTDPTKSTTKIYNFFNTNKKGSEISLPSVKKMIVFISSQSVC